MMWIILDIRKQEEVLQESYMMVPDSKGRCESSMADLASILVSLLIWIFMPTPLALHQMILYFEYLHHFLSG